MSRLFSRWVLVWLALLAACTPRGGSSSLSSSFQPVAHISVSSSATPTFTPGASATLATPTPSSTPTVSVEAASRRPAANGVDMTAQRLASPPALDGRLDEWNGFPCFTLDQKEQIVSGESSWQGVSDLSGSFCWGWDDQALYLAAEIRDDAVRAFSAASPEQMGDRIELWLDVNLLDDFTHPLSDSDDFHFAFSPGNFADLPARMELLAPALAPEAREEFLRHIQARFQPEGSRYRGEIRIPWQVFGSALNLREARLGAALSLVDSDSHAPSLEHVLSTARALLSRPNGPTAWNNLDLLDALQPTPTAPQAAQSGPAFISASFRHLLPDQHLMLYIDCRSGYGEDAVPGIRADYLVQDGGLHYWSAEKGNKGWKWLGLVPFSNKNGQASWLVSHGWLSLCDPSQPWQAVFQRLDKNWNQYYFSPALEINNHTTVNHTEAPLISVTFNHHTPADHLFVYIDADNKEDTGNTVIFPGRGIDYILQDDSLYQWTGLPMPNDWKWLALVRTEHQPNTSTWVFSSAYLGFPVISASSPIKMGFSRQDASWSNQFTSPILWIPDYTVVYNEPALFDITYNHAIPDDHVFVYIDSDHNASTGASGYPLTGVDYVLQDGSLYRWNGSSMDWVASVRTVDTSTQDRWVFSSSFIHNLSFPIHLVFSRQNSSWSALYTSGTISSTAYTITHSEPPPTPTPTPTPTPIPAPMYSFTFNNNYSSGDRLRLYLNTDNNLSTGDWIGGADYLVEWYPDGSAVGLYQWTGTWTWASCSSLSASGTNTTTWSFQATCIGSPSFPFTANFVRMNSSYAIQHNGGPVSISGYTASYTEPAPPPAFSVTFNNNYNSGDRLRLYLNTDNNLSTGDWIGGADYLVEWYPDGSAAGLYQWTGTWTWVSCSSLSASGTNTTIWSFQATCIGSPSFPFTANFVRMDGSSYGILYNGGPFTVSGYTFSHTEP